MTTTTTVEIESYYEGVRAALADLPPDVRDDLLEDLPDHLAEVMAEDGSSLIGRLGDPASYAAELRAAAGVEPVTAELASPRFQDLVQQSSRLLKTLDAKVGPLFGFTRAVELLRSLRTGWWLLRGWIVAQAMAGRSEFGNWAGPIPEVGGNRVLGFLVLVGCVIGSFWFGRWSRSFSIWPRLLTIAGNLVIVVAGLTLVQHVHANEVSFIGNGYADPSNSITDLYAYDSSGNPLTGVRLFDQDGNPVQLGNAYCNVGDPQVLNNDNTGTQTYLYPLCPQDGGPFTAGPGAVPSSPGSVPSASVPSASVPSASALPGSGPSNKVPVKPTGKPTVKPTR